MPRCGCCSRIWTLLLHNLVAIRPKNQKMQNQIFRRASSRIQIDRIRIEIEGSYSFDWVGSIVPPFCRGEKYTINSRLSANGSNHVQFSRRVMPYRKVLSLNVLEARKIDTGKLQNFPHCKGTSHRHYLQGLRNGIKRFCAIFAMQPQIPSLPIEQPVQGSAC